MGPGGAKSLVVKEFMPAGLASRHEWRVGPFLPEQQGAYDDALAAFVDQARWLARTPHAGLVPVHSVWESHGTACAAMPLIGRKTLLALLAQQSRGDQAGPGAREGAGAVSEPAALARWLKRLADALALLHASGRLHLGLSPEKVLIGEPDGEARLLALGARPWRGERAQPIEAAEGDLLPVVPALALRPGFAPLESYPASLRGERAVQELHEGPWSDVYALGALAFCAITGSAPPSAESRSPGDTAQPLVRQARGRYDERLLDAIDRALALLPAQRPQSCAELLELAGLQRSAAPARVPGVAEPPRATEVSGAVVAPRPEALPAPDGEEALAPEPPALVLVVPPARPDARSARKVAVLVLVGLLAGALVGAAVMPWLGSIGLPSWLQPSPAPPDEESARLLARARAAQAQRRAGVPAQGEAAATPRAVASAASGRPAAAGARVQAP
jgi:hypothetical protein